MNTITHGNRNNSKSLQFDESYGEVKPLNLVDMPIFFMISSSSLKCMNNSIISSKIM